MARSTRSTRTTTRKSAEKPCAEFQQVRDFITRFVDIPDPDADVVALWAMGTWTFSPACGAQPFTYPYLYLTGGKGSGKTHLGKEVLQYVTRQHNPILQVTGAALFRMMGDYDAESGQVIPHYPTLAIDEVDAVYSSGGSNDEALRGVANAGYKRGQTVPRAAGKTTVNFPVYCPKLFMGIDNGRLPETLTDRCIRIDMKMSERMGELEEGPYSWEVEEESAELQERVSQWAKANCMVLQDYKPERGDTTTPRQWEICRTLIQLAKACGIESRIRADLQTILSRSPERVDGRIALYGSILSLFQETGSDRLTTAQIMSRLRADNVRVPGQGDGSGKGLSKVLETDGIAPKVIYLPPGHPGGDPNVDSRQRGYFRNQFDDAFIKYLPEVDTF